MVVEGVGGMPVAESTTQEVLKYATLCPCLGGMRLAQDGTAVRMHVAVWQECANSWPPPHTSLLHRHAPPHQTTNEMC